jgi:hypothetical protein
MSTRGDNGGKAPSFDVFSAVSGGRSVAEASRSVVQKQGDAIRNAEAKRCREQEGMKPAAAFGSASRFAAAQRMAGGGLAAVPVPRAGDISPRPADCAEEGGCGAGSADNSPRGRSRSPSFKPYLEAWCQKHPEFEDFKPKIQRKRTIETNTAVVACGSAWASHYDHLQPLVTAKHMRMDSRHNNKLVAVKAQIEGERRSSRAGVSDFTTQAGALQRQREEGTDPADSVYHGGVLVFDHPVSNQVVIQIKNLVSKTPAEMAAEFVGLGGDYTKRVLGQYVVQGEVPPGDERDHGGRGAWEEVATTCLCGCADAGGSDEGESESEDDDADDTTLSEEARARKKQATLQRQLEAFKSRLAPILSGRQNFNQGGSGGNMGKMSSTSR